MWPTNSQMYYLANREGSPVLVKYAEGVCYLPVFESKTAAAEAANNLAGASAPAVIRTEEKSVPVKFSWSAYRTWRYAHLEHGHGIRARVATIRYTIPAMRRFFADIPNRQHEHPASFPNEVWVGDIT